MLLWMSVALWTGSPGRRCISPQRVAGAPHTFMCDAKWAAIFYSPAIGCVRPDTKRPAYAARSMTRTGGASICSQLVFVAAALDQYLCVELEAIAYLMAMPEPTLIKLHHDICMRPINRRSPVLNAFASFRDAKAKYDCKREGRWGNAARLNTQPEAPAKGVVCLNRCAGRLDEKALAGHSPNHCSAFFSGWGAGARTAVRLPSR